MLLAGGDSSRSENAILVELAADRGNLNMTQFLIEGGADVTKAPVLYCASYHGDLEQCQRWVQTGASWASTTKTQGASPPSILRPNKVTSIFLLCEYFIELGSDLNIAITE